MKQIDKDFEDEHERVQKIYDTIQEELTYFDTSAQLFEILVIIQALRRLNND